MELNNFEKQIKEKLNQREIQPSSNSWDRLDAMLSVNEEKKTKRSFGWLYIAASILVLVTAGLFFINQNNSTIKIDENSVTNQVNNDSLKPKIEKENSEENVVPIQKTQQLVQVEENTISKPQNTIKNKEVSIIKNNQNQKISTSQNQQEIVQVITKKEEEVLPKDVIVNPEEQITIAENPTKTQQNQTIKVDASSLLSQVDGELEQSFRQKVISKIAKNYQEVKVALANRNQEK
jgi:hypothetical protein